MASSFHSLFSSAVSSTDLLNRRLRFAVQSAKPNFTFNSRRAFLQIMRASSSLDTGFTTELDSVSTHSEIVPDTVIFDDFERFPPTAATVSSSLLLGICSLPDTNFGTFATSQRPKSNLIALIGHHHRHHLSLSWLTAHRSVPPRSQSSRDPAPTFSALPHPCPNLYFRSHCLVTLRTIHGNHRISARSNPGKPSKPEQNFVQPVAANKGNPPARRPNPAASLMPRNKQRQLVDYDDDSEVEMLSISSDDEDSSTYRGLGSKKRQPKGGRDDDKEWDGEEPDCWKRVDESERNAADLILLELQNNPDTWLQVVHILSNTQNLNTKFFALQGAVDTTLADRECTGLDSSDARMSCFLNKALVNVGGDLARLVPGRVSTEVDARLAYDTHGIVRKVHDLLKLYSEIEVSPERLLFKIPSTWQGIEASRLLESEGIRTHMTFVYSFCQAAAAAQAGSSVIQIFVGRIRDWARNHSGDPEIEAALKRGEDPGLALVTKAYNYIHKYGHKSKLMAAAIRNKQDVFNVLGVDYIITPLKILQSLKESVNPPDKKYAFVKRLSPNSADAYKFSEEELEKWDQYSFASAMGPASVELLTAGLEGYANQAKRVEDLFGKMWPPPNV